MKEGEKDSFAALLYLFDLKMHLFILVNACLCPVCVHTCLCVRAYM